MIVAIDIGNTTVSMGIIRSKRIVRLESVECNIAQTELTKAIMRKLTAVKRKYPGIAHVVLCSVVPPLLTVVERSVKQIFKIKPLVIGRDIKVPIRNKYHKPKQVGQDRLVGAYAAKMLYGAPVIVIDFGTAITFDVVSRQGHYEGGIIVPGIRLTAESLYAKTALLPKIDTIKGPRTLIGKNTQESILSGIFNGYGALCAGLIDQITSRIRGKPQIIITGGHTRLMKRYIHHQITLVDKDLVFKGMGLLLNASRVT